MNNINKNTSKSRVLILDIETAPETAYIWKRFKETVGQTQIKSDGYILCLSWAWLGEPVQNVSIYKNRSWLRGVENDDRNVIKKAHELLCEADIVVGHNVKSFDLATLNAKFAKYNLPPPVPYKICDTLEILKKKFRLASNSLESASHYFGIQIKEKQSFSLWRDCLLGVPSAWTRLVDYCNHDVKVVEELYVKLIPWDDSHPNMGLYEEDGSCVVCPKCGSHNLMKRGLQLTIVNKYQRYQCKDCGGWARGRTPIKINKNNILTHATN